jgi:hypothetical protein
MATAWMVNDDLAINRVNPYTWSGTYGVNKDGFPKNLYMDGSYTTQIDASPMETSGRPDLDNEMNFDFAGGMYVKASESKPAPFRPFPARKFEYPDGTVTWHRPYLPWSWEGAKKGSQEGRGPVTSVITFFRDNTFLIALTLLVLVFYIGPRMRKGR